MPIVPRLLLALALFSAGTAAAVDQSPGACRISGVRHQLLCGSVSRALDPQRPNGRQIDVHYVIVPALARNKRPDPVLLLAGGPGQSAISLAHAVLPLLGRLNNRRDLIFVDQRGTGRSAPLECEEPREQSLAEQFDPATRQQRLVQCRQRLASLPYLDSVDDLRFFTTSIAIGDIDAVRRQLGYDQLNLIGASYGTRVALEMLRQFPTTVRRAVLDGVAPPDMALPASMSIDNQQALDAMFAACAAEPACRVAYPRLRSTWLRLLDSLPKTVELRDPYDGHHETLQLSREMVLGAVRGPLYAASISAALPAAISAAAAGRFEPLVALTTMVGPRPGRRQATGIAAGMHFSVVCAEDFLSGATADRPDGGDFGSATRELYQQVCSDWPRGDIDPNFYRILPSRAAVLLLSGGADPATPPRHARRVAQQLGPLASHRVVAHAGHGVLAIGCVRDIVYRFIDAEDDAAAAAVDSSCVESIPRPPAFVPPGAPRSQR